MSLFPDEDILTKEIESWKGFADSLKSEEDKNLFLTMLNNCQKYALAINAKETPFLTEPLIMALLLTQDKRAECRAHLRHYYHSVLAEPTRQ
jgi:hypothetical protein